MPESMVVVSVHGWSVHDTDIYGELPRRLLTEAAAGNCPPLAVHNIFLGKYNSFCDEVRVEDISRGFEAALQAELGPQISAGRRFVCITHSTGGPVARDWLELGSPETVCGGHHATDATAPCRSLRAMKWTSCAASGMTPRPTRPSRPFWPVSRLKTRLIMTSFGSGSPNRMPLCARTRGERHHNKLFPDNFYIHDAYSMIVLRLRDDRGYAIDDFDLLFTGKKNDLSNLSCFVNHDKMHGMGPVEYKGEVLRKPLSGAGNLVCRSPRDRTAVFPLSASGHCC